MIEYEVASFSSLSEVFLDVLKSQLLDKAGVLLAYKALDRLLASDL